MKKNMSIKIIAAACLCAAIGLTACKAFRSFLRHGERAALPEGDGHTYDTAFVKAVGVECVFHGFHLAGIRGGRFEE